MDGSAAAGAAPLEGTEILCELPGQTGVLLWKTLCSVRLWADGAHGGRTAELFAPGGRARRNAEITLAGVARELAPPLEVLAGLLDPSGGMGKEKVSAACGQVARWAGAGGALATALAFSEAAALASPDDAGLALQAARDARANEEIPRAEGWCRRAIELARRSSDWDTQARAVLTLEKSAKHRGNYPAARKLAGRALELASRHALHEVRAMALHELFAIAIECDDVGAAERYVGRAYRAYGACHRDLHFLTHDVCCGWMAQGQYQRAVPALRSILPLFAEGDRFTVAANVVRATGGLGDRKEFRRAWSVAIPLVEQRHTHGSVGNALLTMALGATGVAEWALARTMAEWALGVATEKGEWEIVFDAERTLDCVVQRRSALPPAR